MVKIHFLLLIFILNNYKGIECCVEILPDIVNANSACSNLTRVCSVSCLPNYIYFDGNTTKSYSCHGDGTWFPAVPSSGCLERTRAVFWLRFEVSYTTTGLAYYCREAHEQALNESNEILIQQISLYCNNPLVSVGTISIEKTTSTTSSFTITTIFELEVGDTSTTESNKDACASLLAVNVNRDNLLVYGDSLECSTGQSNITKSSASVTSDISRCPDLNILVTDNKNDDFCVPDIPILAVESFLYTANISQDIILHCDILFGSLVTSILWKHNDQNITISDTDKYNGSMPSLPSLTIHNITYDDAGLYMCTAENINGVGSSSGVTLNVIARAEDIPQVTIEKDNYEAIAGGNITLVCKVSAYPAVTNVEWLRNVSGSMETVSTDNSKFFGSFPEDPSLTIVLAELFDSGSYMCTATNIAGTGETFITILTVNGDLPNVYIAEESYTVVLGSNVTVNCNFTSNPPVTNIQWKHNNSGIITDIEIDGKKYSGSTLLQPSLVIANVSFQDSGEYLCTVTNFLGNDTGDHINVHVFGEVPSVEAFPSVYSVIVGDNVTVNCNVTGIPEPLHVSWIKNDSVGNISPIGENSTKYIGGELGSPSLSISDVDNSDEGFYLCKASNLAGTSYSEPVYLNVTGDVPEVIIELKEYTVIFGDNITMTCYINSHPTYTSVFWQKNSSNSYVDIEIDHETYVGGAIGKPSLTVCSVNFTHQGYYRCGARNQLGVGFSNFTFLNVIGDKPAVHLRTTIYHVLRTDNITLFCNVSATPFVTGVQWLLNRTNETELIITDDKKYSGSTVDDPSLTMWNVNNSNEGWYICSAENLIGITFSDQVFVNVTGDIPLVVIPHNRYEVVLGDNITIPCYINSHPVITRVSWIRNISGEFTPIETSSQTFSGSSVTEPSIMISGVKFGDQGEYVCVASNFVGESKSNVTILVVTGDPPVVSLESVQYHVTEDDNITLHCNASGTPKVQTVSWKLNITSSADDLVRLVGGTVFDPSLSVIITEIGDTGWYTCTATNLAGTTYGEAIYLNVTEKCIKYLPGVGNSFLECTFNNGAGSCSITCNTGYIFRDGTGSKDYTCAGRRNWSPPLPIPTCLETAPSTYLLVLSITYRTSALALSCLESHDQAVIGGYDTMIQQLSVYCNNALVNVGPIVINSTNSSTSSFDITTTYFIIVGDQSISKSNKDACGSLVEVNIHKTDLMVYGSSLQCPKETSTVTKTGGSVISKDNICPRGFSLIQDSNICVSDIPRVGSTEPSYYTSTGNNMTLFCDVASDLPIDSVYWEFTALDASDASAVYTNDSNRYAGGTKGEPSLTIFNASYADVGVYRCVAVNSAGSGTGPAISFDVISTEYDLPSVEISSSNYEVVLGENITLGCIITSDLPLTNVNWQIGDNGAFRDIIIDNVNFRGSSESEPDLIIIDTGFTDEGQYRCRAINYAGSGISNVTTLTVIGDSPFVTVSTTYNTVQFGESITLHCNISGVPTPTNVVWVRNNSGNIVEIDGSSKHYTGSSEDDPSLTIVSANTTDEGWYVCRAVNLAGTTDSQQLYLNVTSNKPVIKIPNLQYKVFAGEEVTLDCIVNAYPPVISSLWTRNVTGEFENINIDDTKFTIVSMSVPSLTIKAVGLNDTGSYRCQATSDAGTSYGMFIQLTVLGEKPSVHMMPEHSAVFGSNISLTCDISSLPNLTDISWRTNISGTFMDIIIDFIKYSGANLEEPSLTILNLNFQDSGYYLCSGTNFVGTSSKITELKIEGGVPSVYVSSDVYHVRFGENVTLFCNASATPNITTLRWQTNTSGLSDINHTGGTMPDLRLTLYNVDETDGGWYVCTATNVVGTGQSIPVFVNVTGEEICSGDVFPSIRNGISTCSDDAILLCTVTCNSGYVTRSGNAILYFRCENNLWRPPLPPQGCIDYVLPYGEFRLQMTYNFTQTALSCFASHETILESSKTSFGQQVIDICNNDVFQTGILEIVNITSQASGFTIISNFTVRTKLNTATKADRDLCEILLNHSLKSLSIFAVTSNVSCGSGSSSVGEKAGLLLSSSNICPSGTSIVQSTQETYCISEIPSVVILKPLYTAEKEDSLTIECTTESNIKIETVYWIRNHSGDVNIIYGNQTGYSGSTPTNPSLTINDADFSDIGQYTCVAVNSIGIGSSAPTMVNVIERVRDLPIITGPNTILQYAVGSTAKLDCSVNAKSESSLVFWQHNKNGVLQILQPFTFTSRYKGSTPISPALEINNIIEDDTGKYTCFAVNILGVGQGKSIQLTVESEESNGGPETGQSTSNASNLSCIQTFGFILLFAVIGIVLLTSIAVVIYIFLPNNEASLFIENARKWTLSVKTSIIIIEICLSVVTACALSGIITVTQCSEDSTGATMGLTSTAILPGIVISMCYMAFCCYIEARQNKKIKALPESEAMLVSSSPVIPDDDGGMKIWRSFQPSEHFVVESEPEGIIEIKEPDLYASTFKSQPIISKPTTSTSLGRQALPPIEYKEYSEERKKRRKRRRKKRKKETFDTMNDSYDEQ